MDGEDLGAAARRGLFYITGAKLWFMVAGMLIQFLLPRALGSAALFGVWTLVLAWMSWPNNVVITATIQTVSYFAALSRAATERAKATALRMQVLVGGGTALLFFLLAPLIGAFEHDRELVPHLRLAAGVVLCYSFYAVFVGAANGARDFQKQGGLDMIFSTLRAALVLTAAWRFHSTLAAVSGFVAAAAIILLLAALLVGLPQRVEGDRGPQISAAAMLRFSGWLILYLGAINLLMFLDGFWLKRLYTEALAMTDPAGAKALVDARVGVYGAAQTVARLPYQLILAGAFVIFPLMSKTAHQQDRERTRGYIAVTLRYSLVATVAMAVGLGARPEATLILLYPREYAPGGPALAVLLLGYVLFALFTIVGTILNGVGRTRVTTGIALVTVLATNLAVYSAIRLGLAHGDPLRYTALGMVLGMAGGFLLALAYLYRVYRASFAPLSLVRVGAAAALVLLIGRLWPAAGSAGLLGSKLGTLLAAGLLTLAFLGALVLSGELSRKELLAARRGV